MLAEQGLDTADVAAHARTLAHQFQIAITAGKAGPLGEAEILNPVEGEEPRARFLALRHDKASEWRGRLLDAGVVTDVRDDVIRFGFGLYQDAADVERLIAACRAL
jgi:kynureninase